MCLIYYQLMIWMMKFIPAHSRNSFKSLYIEKSITTTFLRMQTYKFYRHIVDITFIRREGCGIDRRRKKVWGGMFYGTYTKFNLINIQFHFSHFLSGVTHSSFLLAVVLVVKLKHKFCAYIEDFSHSSQPYVHTHISCYTECVIKIFISSSAY